MMHRELDSPINVPGFVTFDIESDFQIGDVPHHTGELAPLSPFGVERGPSLCD